MLTQCKTCKATVKVEVHGHFEGEDDFIGRILYTLASCPQCLSPFLLAQDDWEGKGTWDTPRRLFPKRDDFVMGVPKAIKNAFAEASNCHSSGSHTACAIMCRKTLEGVCENYAVEGRSLMDRLKGLKDKGVIDGKLYEWSDELRIVGNEAAHDVNVEVSEADANDMLVFTKALLEYVYTFHKQFEEFKKRRAKK